MISETEGNVLHAKEDMLIHGCNCFNTWGAGIALKIKNIYPLAYQTDSVTLSGDKNKLGKFTYWKGLHRLYEQSITVINLYTQYGYGVDIQHADYDAIENGLLSVKKSFPDNSIAMPKIGSGLGGGDWAKIKKIIENVFNDISDVVNIYYL